MPGVHNDMQPAALRVAPLMLGIVPDMASSTVEIFTRGGREEPKVCFCDISTAHCGIQKYGIRTREKPSWR
ncbi:MAG: hypothetical protein GWN41_00040 [Phycisphaerae bacterium]|nr:hypothetical protein [Phycisphaerae bacterium]